MAQQESQTSLYTNNPLLFNPAFSGTFPYSNIQAGSRFQWIGIKGAPMTQYITFNTGFKKKSFGIGGFIMNDMIGSRLIQSSYISFGYNFRLNRKNHRIALGISGGVDIQHLNFQNLYVNDDDLNDPFRINQIQWSPNVGAGIYYYGEPFFVGFSVPRILQNRISASNSLSPDHHNLHTQHFYLMGGYTFRLTNTINLKTSAMMKFVVNAPPSFDIMAAVTFYDRFLVGVNYRYPESIGVIANFKLGKKWTIGYAYDFPVNDIVLKQWGTHEIMIGLTLDRERKKSPVSCFYF